MPCYSDKHPGAARVMLTTVMAWVLAPSPGEVVGQMYAQRTWIAPPPPVVWVSPPPPVVNGPVWVMPSQQMTTFYPPSTIIEQVEESETVLPPAEGQLRVTVTEAFLAKLISRDDTNAGPVRECILGADVFGEQFTLTHTTVDLQPCLDRARFVLRLTGNVSERTVGVTQQAQVQSQGAHQFQMEKQIDFDGMTFTTRSPAAWVVPRISYRGATTFVSGVPVVGDIARSIALTEAERRRPQAEQIASQMLTRQAAPRFNDEVDRKLSEANRKLAQYVPALLQWIDLSADQQSLSTTSDQLLYQIKLPRPPAMLGQGILGDVDEVAFENLQEPLFLPSEEDPVTTSSTFPEVTAGESITIALHEDLVNHVLASLPLGGQEIPDKLIDRLIEILLQTIENQSFDPASLDVGDSSEAEFATVLLAEDQPLSIRFEDGRALVTARAGFRPKLTPEVPTQRIEIPYHVSQTVGQIALEPSDVTVTATLPEDTGPLADLARPIIQQQITQRLHTVSLPTTVDLNLPEMTPTRLTVRQVVLENGWLMITLD
ncbi:MAG: hypothetical protein R3B91_04505 [Planctomycetaceae bacterium]